MRFLDKDTLSQIGYTFVISLLNTVTAMGKETSENVKPYGMKGFKALLEEYKLMDIIEEKIISKEDFTYLLIHTLSKTKDIRNTFKKSENATLTEVELYEVKYFANLCMEIHGIMAENNALIPNIKINPLKELYDLLDPDNTGIMTFYLYDSYDSRLKEIRERKKVIEEEIVRASDKEELLRKRSEIVAIEEDIGFEVRSDLTAKIREYKEYALESFKSIGILDFEMGKLLLAKKYGCTKPTITKGDTLTLIDCIHPEIKHHLEKRQKDFTPTSIVLSSGVSLLTGANMGGKSVTMKNVTLNVYLCQIGFYPFARQAEIPIFDFIHFVSSDLQKIEQGLSTFGGEIIKLKETIMYANAVSKIGKNPEKSNSTNETYGTAKGFIVLDELARGTNPSEGKSIVEGVSEYLSRESSIAFISTHYDGIHAKLSRRYQVIGLKNVDFAALKYKIDLNKGKSVDILQQYMDYRLEEVTKSVVPKDALNVATLLGLQEDVIRCIRKWY